MTSSIVISTYNGEKFLIEQLDSIKNQTKQPDFVYICDDCSTDKTPELIQEYINKNNLKNWSFEINKENLGWKVNFYKLMQKPETDIIFLCDQDDIWHKQKLELMIPCFANKNINVLCCKQHKAKNNIHIKNKIIKKIKPVQKCFYKKFQYINRPGCTYAIRRQYISTITKWWEDYLPHDAFLFRNALLDDSLYFIKQKLTIRRIHSNNASINKGDNRFKINLNYYINVCNLLLNRLENDDRIKNKENKRKILKKAIIWQDKREKFYVEPDIHNFIILLTYYGFYLRSIHFIKELLIARQYKRDKK